MREKEQQAREEAELKLREQIERDVEEIKKIRAATCFKATPVMYNFEQTKSVFVQPKELTQPKQFHLQTESRAQLKQINLNLP